MLIGSGASQYYCVKCKKKVDIFVESDNSPIFYRVKDYFKNLFGIRDKCPECGSLDFIGRNVDKCPECKTGNLKTNDPKDRPWF
jgi:endogenous inhibitor of DNA gyrase (YacG/DUF329 family)